MSTLRRWGVGCVWSVGAGVQAIHAQRALSLAGTPLSGASAVATGISLDLGVVLGGAIARNGDVLIVEQGNPAVSRISTDGRRVAQYGRGGDGPGEHRFPYRVAELSDGAVLVYDLAIRRFSEYTPEGRFVKRWTTSADLVSLDAIVPLPERGFAVSGIVRDPNASKHGVHVFDSTFTLRRSFGDLPPARSREILEQWGAGHLAATRDGGLLFSRRLPYELSVFSRTGARSDLVRLTLPVSERADDAFVVQSANGTVTTSVRKDVAYPLEAIPLPNGAILSARLVAGRRRWDFLDGKGRVTWTGAMPSAIAYCLGVDTERRTLWCVGEQDDVPVLYRIGV